MNRVAIVRVRHDIYEPDWIGNGAREYCEEHGLMHLAFRKGELLVMSVDEYMDFWGKHTEAEFAAAFANTHRGSTDAVSSTKLKKWAESRGQSDATLAEAIKARSHYCGSNPSTDQLEFVKFVNGEVPLTSFQITV